MHYEWSDKAACVGMDPALFYPARFEDHVGREAKRVCASCPVREECLETSLQRHEYGVWGGTSEKQRRRMRRRGHGAA